MLIVARHGRTEANASGLLLGRRLDPDLDVVGRDQAVALAAAVGRVDRVICSPLSRARQTAAAFGRPVEVDERWIELDYGDLDGTPMRDVPADLWERWRADDAFSPPGGESHRDLHTRVAAACDRLGDLAAEHDVVVVTHVSPIKAAVAWTLGVEPTIAWRMHVAPGSITRISTSRGPSLRAFNDTAHLDPAAPGWT